MSNVVVSAGIRNSLFALNSAADTATGIQKKLATGLKINSALDGASSFFAAQGLNNKANDLSRLLDAMGQSIQTIKAADNAVTSMTKLVEQADSIASQARDSLSAANAEAKANGSVSLKGVTDLTSLTGVTAAGGDSLIIDVTDKNGNLVDSVAGGAHTPFSIQMQDGDSTEQFIARINNQRSPSGEQLFSASLNDKGQLELKSNNGGSLRVQFQSAANNDAGNQAFAAALGFGSVARTVVDGAAGTNNVEFTAVASAAIQSAAFSKDAAGAVADRSTNLSALYRNGVSAYSAAPAAGDTLKIGVNGGTAVEFDVTTTSVQELVDGINNNASLNTKIRADFDDTTGKISIKSLSADVKSVEFGYEDVAGGTANLGFGVGGLTAAATETQTQSVRFGAAAGDIAKLEKDYNKILTQMDQLANDAGYRGTNLLNGDKLTTVFNDDRSSKNETQGQKLNSSGLGMKSADFSRAETVDDNLTQVRAATDTLRSFGSSLAADLSVIQNRQDFTKKSIDTLKEGADKLTVADANEEGAKLTALQTRQQLAAITLSLASQQDQTVLRLF